MDLDKLLQDLRGITKWQAVREASGMAGALPEAMASLCSRRRTEREEAYWKLDNHAVLQGELYEAAPFVARGLLMCLASEPVSREEIYDLLIELANGGSSEEDMVTVDGREPEHLSDATIHVICEGLGQYLEDVRGKDILTRLKAAELLVAIADKVPVDAEDLSRLRAEEPDASVRRVLEELVDVARKEARLRRAE